jgi:hypothetical protein
MAKNDVTQPSTQGAASTVALENLTETIARATLRALDERQLAAAAGSAVNLPIGDGHTVLGILLPCEPFGLGGPGPCHCHVIMGVIIMHPPKFIPDKTPSLGLPEEN